MAQYRKEKLANNEIYHIYTRSIAKYIVFNNQEEYERMMNLSDCYRFSNFNHKYSQFIELDNTTQQFVLQDLENNNELLVKIIAYCFMPTHIHFILQQVSDDGVSKFMSKILNGYSRFFNNKHNRTGPLWSGRFKSVIVSTDEQLLHLTRYIHLNPTSTDLVKKPELWKHSSYNEYLEDDNIKNICNFKHSLEETTPKQYKRFVNNNKQYQKQLSKIKLLLIENYSD